MCLFDKQAGWGGGGGGGGTDKLNELVKRGGGRGGPHLGEASGCYPTQNQQHMLATHAAGLTGWQHQDGDDSQHWPGRVQLRGDPEHAAVRQQGQEHHQQAAH